ncbi:unnamed protein product, partial [Polarella glacialis]
MGRFSRCTLHNNGNQRVCQSLVALAAPLPAPPVTGAEKASPAASPLGLGRGYAGLAAGGGLSALTWLGRRTRRRARLVPRVPAASALPAAVAPAVANELHSFDSKEELSQSRQETRQSLPSSFRVRRKPQQAALRVHFLYASPILRPGSSCERLPALSWQAEAEAVRDALQLSAADEVSIHAEPCRAELE